MLTTFEYWYSLQNPLTCTSCTLSVQCTLPAQKQEKKDVKSLAKILANLMAHLGYQANLLTVAEVL